MFSVIIPLYNKEISISNTIQSVLNQIEQDFEIVVVNDGSTDSSFAVVENFKDSRIKIINKKNGGVSSARNRGIKEAKGEWIAFLDGDDLWSANHLQVVKEMIISFPNESVFATSFDYSDGRKVYRIPRTSNIYKIDNFFKDSLLEPLMWTSIVVVKKASFHSKYFFDETLSLGEDLELWHKLIKKFNLIKSSTITAVYRLDSENRSIKKKINIKSSIISKMTLNNNNNNNYEKIWNKRFVLTKLKAFIVYRDWSSVWYVISRFNVKLFF